MDCEVVAGDALTTSPALRLDRVVSAVLDLQEAGMRVIAIVAGARDPFTAALLAASSDVNRKKLLLHVRELADGAEVFRVAREFCCRFAWADDTPSQRPNLDWTLPADLRTWLEVASPKLQLRSALGLQKTCEAAPETEAALAAAPCTKAGRAASWLEDGLADMQEPPSAVCGGDVASASASVDVASDVLTACVLRVPRTYHSEQLLCVYCKDVKGGPFGAAGSLASDLLGVGGEAYHEEDSTDQELAIALEAKGGWWAWHHLLLTVSCGQHAGLRAVGVGSNMRKRRRAAHLAVAITAILHRQVSAADSGPVLPVAYSCSGSGGGDGAGAVKEKDVEVAKVLEELVAATQSALQRLHQEQ